MYSSFIFLIFWIMHFFSKRAIYLMLCFLDGSPALQLSVLRPYAREKESETIAGNFSWFCLNLCYSTLKPLELPR